MVALVTGGSCRGAALGGKAGVGKSRLARTVAQSATDAGWTVRRVAATATSRSIPLGAFAQWVDDLDGPPPAMARRVVGSLVAGSEAGRLLVFVDDAHLLDDLSALVLHLLVHSENATVLLTVRTGEATPDAVSALWKDGLVEHRVLPPLSRQDSEELLKAALGARLNPQCADRLWRLARGNVLFLRQLVEMEVRGDRMVARDGAIEWSEDAVVPATLLELVDGQIGSVPAHVRDVVDFVAISEPVDWHCLRMLADQAAIEEAEQRELIRTADGLVYVGHPLYAEVRRTRCGPSRLRRLRGEVATAMKDGGSATQVMNRGMLWLQSDLPPEPYVLSSAASAATSLLDFDSAERLLEAAVRVDGSAPARVRRAYNLFMAQQGERAVQVLEDVDAEEIPASVFLNDVVLRAANLLWWKRSPAEAWRVIDDALETEHGRRRPALLVFRALQLLQYAKPFEALEVMAGVERGALDDFGTTIGLCVQSLASAEIGRYGTAMSTAEECGAVIASSEQAQLLSLLLVDYHTFALAAAGYVADAVEVARAHLGNEQPGAASAQAVAAELVGGTMLAAGDLRAALRHLPAASASNAGDANGFHLVHSAHRHYLRRAQVLARRGDPDGADRALATAREHRHPAYVNIRAFDTLTEAWVAASRHRLSEARRLARSAAEFARGNDQRAREVWALQTATQFGDIQGAGRLEELATVVEGPRVAVAARYAAVLSRDDAAGLDQVSSDFEAMGDALAAADAVAQAAVAHRRAGRIGSAMTSEARMRRLVERCGGATSPAIVAAAPATAPFSDREREIAVLVEQGLSNREIAAAVSLSVRTIEGHILRASAKAGVTGRAGLAAVMRAMRS